MQIVALILRAFQLLFAAVVLALSVVLIKHQGVGSAPATTGYAAFCGGWGLVMAAVGIAATFIEAIPVFIIMGIDALSSLLFLAGGIALAVALKGITCNNSAEMGARMFLNKILNGGCIERDGQPACSIGLEGDNIPAEDLARALKPRCVRAQADYVFLFLTFVLFLVTIGVTFFTKRGGRRGMVV